MIRSIAVPVGHEVTGELNNGQTLTNVLRCGPPRHHIGVLVVAGRVVAVLWGYFTRDVPQERLVSRELIDCVEDLELQTRVIAGNIHQLLLKTAQEVIGFRTANVQRDVERVGSVLDCLRLGVEDVKDHHL